MKQSFKRALSAVMAFLMTASLFAVFSVGASGVDAGYRTGSFTISVEGGVTPNLHDMKLSVDVGSLPSYSFAEHKTLLLALARAETKLAVRQAEAALANYLDPVGAWLALVDADARAQFEAMCGEIETEAVAYYWTNRNLTDFTPTGSFSLSGICWQRSLASASDLAGNLRDYYVMASGSRATYSAAYVAASAFEQVRDLSKTTCMRAAITFTIVNGAHPSGTDFTAYSGEVTVAPHEYHASVPASCTDAGIEEYYVCPDCGVKVSFFTGGVRNDGSGNGTASVRLKSVSDEGLITDPASGHVWNGVVTTPATCAQEGVTTYTCAECGETFTETIPAPPHTVAEGAEWIYAPDGSLRYHLCTVCGNEVDIQEPTALAFPYTQTCGQYKLHGTTVALDQNYPKFDVSHYIDLHFGYKEETDETLKAQKLAERNAYKAFFVNWFTAHNWASVINRVIDYIEADATTRALAEQNVSIKYDYNVQFHLNNGTFKQLYALEGSTEQPGYGYADTVSQIDFSIRPQNGEYDYNLIDKCIIGLYVVTRIGASTSSTYVARLDLSFTTNTKYAQAEAICGSTGYKQDLWYCAACGHYYSYYDPDGEPFTVLCEDGVTRLKLTEVDPSGYLIDPPSASHNYASELTLAPTCTEAGVRTFTCLNCGHSYTLPVDALGHDMQYRTVDPTCTEAGVLIYGCTRCDFIGTSEEIPALGHDYDSTVVSPTCTEAGYTQHVCSRCGDSYTDAETEALGHTPDLNGWYYTASDPELNSPARYHVCSVCGETFDREKPTQPTILGNGCSHYHDVRVVQPQDYPRFDTAEYVALYNAYLALPEGAEKDAAYEQAFGYRRFHRMFVCSRNGYWAYFDAMVDDIEADPDHAVANGWGVSYYYDVQIGNGSNRRSLNEFDGVDDHSFTDVAVFDFSIRPRAQDYPYNGNWDYNSYLYAQLTYRSNTPAPIQVTSAYLYTLFLQTLNEVGATCETDGCRPYFYCSDNSCRSYFSFYSDADTINYVTCEDGVVRQQMVNLGRSRSVVTDLLKVPAFGEHIWGEWTVVNEASCTEDGVMTQTCSVCGEVRTAYSPALGHVYDENVWVYTADGTQRGHLCTVCGQVVEIEDVTEPGGLKGDVDGSGGVDIRDVSALLDFLASGGATPACDVDENGTIDITDVSALLDLLASGG